MKTYFFLETRKLRYFKELFLTMFYNYQQLPITRYQVSFMLTIILSNYQ